MPFEPMDPDEQKYQSWRYSAPCLVIAPLGEDFIVGDRWTYAGRFSADALIAYIRSLPFRTTPLPPPPRTFKEDLSSWEL